MLSELVQIRDTKAYELSGLARTVGAEFYSVTCQLASKLCLREDACQELQGGLSCNIFMLQTQPIRTSGLWLASEALVQSWENFQRGLVARVQLF